MTSMTRRKVVTWFPFVLTLIGTILCFASVPSSIFWQIVLTMITFTPLSLTLMSLHRKEPQLGLPITATVFASFNLLIVFLAAVIGSTAFAQSEENCGGDEGYSHENTSDCKLMKVWIAGIWIIFFMQIVSLVCSSVEIKRVSAASKSNTMYVQSVSQQFPPSVEPAYFSQTGAPQQPPQYLAQGPPYSTTPVYPVGAVYPNQYAQAYPQTTQPHQPPVVELEDA